jgi:hypothetical protein
MPSRKRRKRRRRRRRNREKKTKVSFLNLKRRWKKQCELHHHSLSGDSYMNTRDLCVRASEWINEWVVQFINREYVLYTKSVYIYTVYRVAMMCIVLAMCICTQYSAIEYRWWCEVERKKRRETEKKRRVYCVSSGKEQVLRVIAVLRARHTLRTIDS